MSETYKAIPTNLITGFLGSGKTTVILELLKSRPENSHWAVLVNEFGDVGIDGAMLKDEGMGDGIFIKEVPGGCICCAAGLPLQMALNLLIKQAQPERILIEPTGVGHPKKVMDTLTGEFYSNVLDIRATICLVEAHKLNDSKYLDNETFIDQINIADVLLASKSDQATTKDLEHFNEFAQAFQIPKDHIDCIEFGHVSADVLDINRNKQRCVEHPHAHASNHTQKPKESAITPDELVKDMKSESCDWRRFENNGQDYYGCGWIFNRSIVFDEVKLEKWINDKVFTRVKGIFRTSNGWLLFNRSEQQFVKEPSSYSDDSRVELIEPDYHDWNQVEIDLLNCIESFGTGAV